MNVRKNPKKLTEVIIMIGAITGDVAGSRFEFRNYRAKDFELFSKNVFSQMTA